MVILTILILFFSPPGSATLYIYLFFYNRKFFKWITYFIVTKLKMFSELSYLILSSHLKVRCIIFILFYFVCCCFFCFGFFFIFCFFVFVFVFYCGFCFLVFVWGVFLFFLNLFWVSLFCFVLLCRSFLD